MNRGKYIVLEGAQGVGKTTQLLELVRRLQAAGLPVRALREPDSQSDLTARAVRQLTQDPRYPMNTNTEVLLYNAARSQSLQIIKKSIEQGVICVVDRNYLTTLAIQYYGRGDISDYEAINKIIEFAVNGMEPDLCIILDAPVQTLKERTKFRGQGERFDNLDEAFLERVRAGYLWEAKQRSLPVIFANDDEQTVTEAIWKLVTETLAIRDKTTTSSKPTSVKQIIDQKKQTAIPYEPPLGQGTSISLDATKLPPPDVHITLENVSELLLSSLNIPSSALPSASLTDRGSADQKLYFVPPQLTGKVVTEYCQKIEAILELHQSVYAELIDYLRSQSDPTVKDSPPSNEAAIRTQAERICQSVLPLAAATTTHIAVTSPTASALLDSLVTSELAEARPVAQVVWDQAQLLFPKDTIDPPIIVQDTATITLAATYLPDTYTNGASAPVSLSSVWPKAELSLVPDMLYSYSNLPLRDITQQVDGWSYDKKAEVFTSYVTDKGQGEVLQSMHYTWDLVSDFAAYTALQRAHIAQTIVRQPLTPRFGYDTPEILEEAGLSDQYEQCFSLSLELYSLLQESGHAQEAEYAVLQGHKLRYTLSHTAKDIPKLLDLQSDPQLNYLTQAMYSKLTEVHPLLTETVSNRATDAE